jgi:hypothetical protein
VNDTSIENAKTRISITESIANIHYILNEAKKLYPIVVISTPPIANDEQDQRIANLSQEFTLVCQELNIRYLNIFSKLISSNSWV